MLAELGAPRFRCDQIWKNVYANRLWGYDAATNLPDSLKEVLGREHPLKTSKLVTRANSADRETSKILMEFSDGATVETVLIKAPQRRTVCISSQAGCDMGCKFCASAIGGLERNLTAAEMLEQFVAANSISDESLTHVVVMGMGEPLLNYDNLVKFLNALVDEDRFGISHRRITVSTIGVVEAIHALAKEPVRVSLAISLHSHDQVTREMIVPAARRWDFDSVLNAAAYYQQKTGRQVTIEYCLIRKVNDLKAQAKLLADRIRDKGFAVNLIPYNPIGDLKWERPESERVEKFRDELKSNGIVVIVRREKGVDISAACGQLRRARAKE